MPAHLKRCPACREEVPEIRVTSHPVAGRTPGRDQMRRGFLYMLLAGVVQFFAGGYSGMNLPITVPPMVSEYLVPLVFLAGLGMLVYGLCQRMRN